MFGVLLQTLQFMYNFMKKRNIPTSEINKQQYM